MRFGQYLQAVQEKKPRVHCITNYVTMNDCANIVLACGGKPVMASRPEEAEQISHSSDSLLLNLGTLHDEQAMLLAGRESNVCGHPVVLDPVGVGASDFRKTFCRELLGHVRFRMIRGNLSEIRFLATGKGRESGVDASARDVLTCENAREVACMARDLAGRLGCVVAISGCVDVVADADRALSISGGSPLMARVTGTGCMSGALMAAFLGADASDAFEAGASASAFMKVCGALAGENGSAGTMAFRMRLIDEVSLLSPERLDCLAVYSQIF